MESRRVYLEVAGLLRGGAPSQTANTYPHTFIHKGVKMGVLESEYLLLLRLSNLVSFATLHSHQKADFSAAFNAFKKKYHELRSTIPYIGAVDAVHAEDLEDERIKAVREWKRIQAERAKEERESQ